MRILVAGATGSIGIHVVNTAIAMGHQPVTLVRNRRKIKLLPRGTDIFYGDVSIPETLTDLPKDIDAIIFTLGSDGQGRIGARAIDYGGVRNILRIFMDTPVRIALMTTIGVTERLSSWNQRTEVHDWKRRSERLVRASGHIYTIVRPGWFDYNNDDEHRIVMLQGDRRHAGTPEDGVISREQIAQVLVTALSNDAAKNKTFELVAERGEAQQDLTPLFAELRNDNPQKNDGDNIIFLGLCLGLTTYSALSADSVIKISGRVLDYGCTVSSDSLNFTVDLQKNSARQFPTTGSTSPAVPFQITLSECSKGTTGVRVAFNGIEDAENNTLLKLDEGSNTASGLGIEILDGNMRPVKLNDLHAGMQWIPLVPDQNNILPYSARLKSTQKSVNPGLVSASATFTLEFQ
ncbi:TPA: NAD(P)H-binding protein [Escherichia coli]|nr:NAD(P)H-binding protein [Escherichia coli]